MVAGPDVRTHRRWRTVRAARLAIAAEHDEPCAWCALPVDYAADGRDPHGPSVDHVVPIEHGGDPHDLDNLAPMHRWCNLSKGTKPMSAAPRYAATTGVTRRWV